MNPVISYVINSVSKVICYLSWVCDVSVAVQDIENLWQVSGLMLCLDEQLSMNLG